MVAISSPSLSGIRTLACTLGYNFFCKGLRGHMWHAPRAPCWPETGIIVFPLFRRIECLFVRPDPTSRSGSRGENAWAYIHTYIHTYTQTPGGLLFQRPTRGNLREKAFNARVLKPFYSTILKNVILPLLGRNCGRKVFL